MTTSHGDQTRILLAGIAFLELIPRVLARALDPFPVAVRTLDALHLATLTFVRERDPRVQLATYDTRQQLAARALGIPLLTL